MDKFQQVPPGITNVPRWEEHCRQVHARATDLIDGKVGVIHAAEVLHRLDSVGIDPAKDGEVFHTAQLAPGKHLFGGWFHFVGTLDVTGDFPPVRFGDEFSAWLCRKSAPNLSELDGLPLVQLEFSTSAVPWRLDEPEAN